MIEGATLILTFLKRPVRIAYRARLGQFILSSFAFHACLTKIIPPRTGMGSWGEVPPGNLTPCALLAASDPWVGQPIQQKIHQTRLGGLNRT